MATLSNEEIEGFTTSPESIGDYQRSDLRDTIATLQQALATRDARIASLEADATDTAVEKKALQAQIDWVRALIDKYEQHESILDPSLHVDQETRIKVSVFKKLLSRVANELLAALGEPAATPERKP